MRIHFLSILLASAGPILPMSAQETLTFAYANKDAVVSPTGSERVDKYDVAIAIDNPGVYGMSVSTIEVPVFPSANVSDLSFWISKELRLQQEGAVKVNVPDVSFPMTMPFAGSDVQWITLNLDQPYEIPQGGLYVGYSFSVNKLDNTPATVYPIVATPGIKAGSLFLHTTRTYKTWEDRTATLNSISMMQVTLTGTTMPANAARMGNLPEKYFAIDQPGNVDVMVYNIGTNPIESLGYTSYSDGKSISKTVSLNPAIDAVFGYGVGVNFEIPEFGDDGAHEYAIQITEVNGTAFSSEKLSGKANVALFIPKHNPLVEEYTGMWCGNCPRGYVAMEYMNEHYPDFIGIAYHNEDQLAMESGDPGLSDSFPLATVDRSTKCDPYFGTPNSTIFNFPAVWESYRDEFAPVEIEVTAKWDGEAKSVSATSRLNWALVPENAEGDNYRMEYVLMGNGFSNPKWYQMNYYADGAKGYPEYMDEFTHAGSAVFGLVYNDVAMLASGFKGVKGSIPSIATGNVTTHTYTFDTEEAYTIKGVPFEFKPDNLYVVACVLKGPGAGTVVNAAKCKVETSTQDSVHAVACDGNVVSVEYYDLNGRKVSKPEKGLFIRAARHADGNVSYRKVIVQDATHAGGM